MASALYIGSVVHRRLRPKRYRLRHAVFWMLIDIDELDTLDRRLKLFSRNRFNAVSFFDRDHGEQTAEPLRSQVERHLRAAGIDFPGGVITLLCMPRILGYGFNPLSIYFCHRNDGTPAAIIYEVRNTFGERHSYLIPVETPAGDIVRQSCEKSFYVSPFMDMAMRYDFRVSPPSKAVSVAISGSDPHGQMIVAALAGQRRQLNDAQLLRCLVTVPLVTLKVVGAIYWHALKMWTRGFTLKARPHRPASTITYASRHERR